MNLTSQDQIRLLLDNPRAFGDKPVVEIDYDFPNTGGCNLDNINFNRSVNIKGKDFMRSFCIKNSSINCEMNIEEATFNDDFVIDNIIEINKIQIKHCKFLKDVHIKNFNGLLQIENTIFYGRVSIDAGMQNNKNGILFRNLEFDKPENVYITHFDISRITFYSTDISKVLLTPRPTKIDDKLLIAADLKGPKDYSQLVFQYQQLRINFEIRGKFAEAGRFYYHEMKNKRLNEPTYKKYFSLHSFYGLLSGYGQLYLRAIFILFIIIIGFGVTYTLGGITNLTLKDNFWNGIIHSLQIATYQKNILHTTRNWMVFAEIVESVLIPIQTTLVVLAIRRKFKR